MERFDVIVLGAGIVGVSAAWHLLKRGRKVALVDRRGPGEETSFGNAGIVERDGFLPMSFPQRLTDLFRYAGNARPELHYHPRFLPRLAPYLLAMRRGSHPDSHAAHAAAMAPLLARTVEEHRELASAAGALGLFRDTGCVRLYRTAAGFGGSEAERGFADRYGARYDVLTPDDLARIEPDIQPVFHRALLWTGAISSSSPGGVAKAYANAFVREGGRLFLGDALSLRRVGQEWQVMCGEGPVAAPVALAALGPWTPDLMQPLGLRFPFAVVRGYHRHFQPLAKAGLSRPVIDVESGFVITPMERGVRLTTAYEFAARDARPTPVQVVRTLPLARQLFPLGETVDEQPWLGRRPCLADSLPVIGWAPRHPGLFLDFGHSHLGFTLGPVTGRLAAEMIVGEAPSVDPRPFAAERFARVQG